MARSSGPCAERAPRSGHRRHPDADNGRLRVRPAVAGRSCHRRDARYLLHGHVSSTRRIGWHAKCGVTHILTKPTEPERILRTVEEVLGLALPTESAPLPPEVAGEHLRLLTNTLLRKRGRVGGDQSAAHRTRRRRPFPGSGARPAASAEDLLPYRAGNDRCPVRRPGHA